MRSFSDGRHPSTHASSSRAVQTSNQPYFSDISHSSAPLRVSKVRCVSEGRTRFANIAKVIFRRSTVSQDDVEQEYPRPAIHRPKTPDNNARKINETNQVTSDASDEYLETSSPDTPPNIARVQASQPQPTSPTPSRRKSLSIKTNFFSNLFPMRQGPIGSNQGGRQFSGQSVASTSSTLDGESPITPTLALSESQFLHNNAGGRSSSVSKCSNAATSALLARTTIRTSSGSYENDGDDGSDGYSPVMENDSTNKNSIDNNQELRYSNVGPDGYRVDSRSYSLERQPNSDSTSFRQADNEPNFEGRLPPSFPYSVHDESKYDYDDSFGGYLVGPSMDPFWAKINPRSSATRKRYSTGSFTTNLTAAGLPYGHQSSIRFVSEGSPSSRRRRFAPHPLNIPEIVSLIIQHVDALTPIPHEVAPKRRSPMSWRHAMLLYGNRSTALEAFMDSNNTGEFVSANQNEHTAEDNQSLDTQLIYSSKKMSPMLSCLLVNRMWYEETCRLLYQNLHFADSTLFTKFVEYNRYNSPRQQGSSVIQKPQLLVLHKLSFSSQAQIETLGRQLGGNLEWLEFYTCPRLYPTRELMRGGTLKKVIVPGCTGVNDNVVALIARDCPLLEHLDLRACEEVSDKSIRAVAHYCRNLVMLNVGRTHGGSRITNRGIRSIARHTQITTLGVAGCHINDTTVWELAIHRGRQLERLSFNNCFLLTNNSVPRILGYTTQRLSVLELRGCPLITNMMPLVLFKRYRQARHGFAPLIEGCELFESRMREAEYMLEMEISKQIFKDTLEWIYGPDSDVEYVAAVPRRRRLSKDASSLPSNPQNRRISSSSITGFS